MTELFSRELAPLEIPDLELVRCIGRGAYGEVWLGLNKVTRHLSAIKIIRLSSPNASDKLGREIVSLIRFEAGVRSSHENLLEIHHVGQTSDCLFYLSPLADDVAGGPASADPNYRPATLAARMESGALPVPEVLVIARQLLAGLAHLHTAGLVHRDVKPENCIFIGGKLTLADFGLLAQADGGASLVGTPRYMPPSGPMDTRADVYAAGLVLYEMLTGLPCECFPRWSIDLLRQRQNPTVHALNRIILRATQPDPKRRFQDAGRMLTAVEAIGSRSQMRRSFRLAVLVGLLCALAAALTWVSRQRDSDYSVNFITQPFEAEILIDDQLVTDPNGTPYRTPCTIPRSRAGVHKVIFRLDNRPDLVAGQIDFSKQREVMGRWSVQTSPHQ